MNEAERTENSEHEPGHRPGLRTDEPPYAPGPAPSLPPPPPPGRRGALGVLVGAGGLAWAGAIGVPAARFLVPEGGPEGGRERWIRVARLADLPPREPRRLAVVGDLRDAFSVAAGERLGSVWVVREGDRGWAFSAACPHLGCTVEARKVAGDPPSWEFSCPCHASRFRADGQVLEGPSPRALDPLAVRVVDGFVEVDFRRFRPGGADRVEASG
jgi:cytochrome b6-f complex iron-sulfur subunit/menaquinol-cytochrome c reductase iron-sulfur subunit